MERKKSAAIFPAFGCKYLGNEQEMLGEISGDLFELLSRAARRVPLDEKEFLSRRGGGFPDELQSQYAVYVYSCAVSNVLKRFRVQTDYVAGYSMGLYAALYHAESITFDQGLDCITAAYGAIRNVAEQLDFGMGVISGLAEEEVRSLIVRFKDVEIININNRHSFLISGYEDSVRNVLGAAKEQGALNAKYASFHSPYHSRFMDDAAREFSAYCSGIRIYDPIYSVISTIDRREMTTGEDILRDLVGNINKNINWLETMTRLIGAGADVFIECGPGKSLYRMAKFIEGDFRVYPLNALRQLLESGRFCGSAQALDYSRA